METPKPDSSEAAVKSTASTSSKADDIISTPTINEVTEMEMPALLPEAAVKESIVPPLPPPPQQQDNASLPPLPKSKNIHSSDGSTTNTTTTKEKKKKTHHKSVSSTLPFIPAASDRSEDPDFRSKKDDRIRLGICAMDKKARSKPMAEILSRLDEDSFQVVFFGDDCILNKPVEEWPICHVLIAFYSKGYPLEKALQYVELRKPFSVNDLSMQNVLKDRRRVYDLLEGSGIDVPRHVYLSRDDYISTGTGDGNGNRDQEVVEHDDHIEVKNRQNKTSTSKNKHSQVLCFMLG